MQYFTVREKTRIGTRGQSEIREKCKNFMYMCFVKTVFQLFMIMLINKVLLVHRRELKQKIIILEKDRYEGWELIKHHLISITF